MRTGVSVTGTVTDRSGRVTGVALRDRADRTSATLVRDSSSAPTACASRDRPQRRGEDARRAPAVASTTYTYVAGLDADGFEFHIGERAFAGVFPTHDGEANVWMCLPGDSARTRRRPTGSTASSTLLEDASPSLAERVAAARITSPVRSRSACRTTCCEAAGPGWALVGDAGYHRDPITGHGITDAFRDAELLARRLGQLLRGDVPEAAALAAYRPSANDALAPIFDVTWRLAQFPPVDQFVELQKRLAVLIDDEATWLAERPLLPAPRDAAASRGLIPPTTQHNPPEGNTHDHHGDQTASATASTPPSCSPPSTP